MIINLRKRWILKMDNMVAYGKILIAAGKEPDLIGLRCDDCDREFVAIEYYCINPLCDCTDVQLLVAEALGSSRPRNDCFLVRLDLITGQVKQRKIYNQTLVTEKMVTEFIEAVLNMKAELFSHLAAAKAYGRKNYLDYVPKEIAKLIKAGNTVCYAQVFGHDEDLPAFSFEFTTNERYLIDDQYCANPKCLCNEAILVFYKIVPDQHTQDSEFVVRINLKSYQYTVEDRSCPEAKVTEIIKYLKANKPETLQILKRRYN